jgi:phosphoribosylglycinamide formyltransferase-1
MIFPENKLNEKLKLALLISGSGTTMQAIIKACKNGSLKGVEPTLVISSNKESGGIEKAKSLGIETENILIIDPQSFKTKEEFGEKIIIECNKRGVNFIGQYGWMVKTPENVIKEFEGKIVNQHPGPLDTGKLDFGGVGMYGLRVHEARLEFVKKTNRDFWTEATSHLVTENFDEGAVLKRRKVPILPYDTAETLQMRVLPIEHEVQIDTLKDFVDNTTIEFRREAPLVLRGEENILKECKEIAKKLYPKG